MTHVGCKSELRSVARSSMHPCRGNRITIRRAVVFYAWAAHEFSAGIKCRDCSYDSQGTWVLTVLGLLFCNVFYECTGGLVMQSNVCTVSHAKENIFFL